MLDRIHGCRIVAAFVAVAVVVGGCCCREMMTMTALSSQRWNGDNHKRRTLQERLKRKINWGASDQSVHKYHTHTHPTNYICRLLLCFPFSSPLSQLCARMFLVVVFGFVHWLARVLETTSPNLLRPPLLPLKNQKLFERKKLVQRLSYYNQTTITTTMPRSIHRSYQHTRSNRSIWRSGCPMD